MAMLNSIVKESSVSSESCTVVSPGRPRFRLPAWGGLARRWAAWRAEQAASHAAWREARALRHLSDTTLSDLNLPREVRARARALREADDERLASMRRGGLRGRG